jgi:hypothetical protein
MAREENRMPLANATKRFFQVGNRVLLFCKVVG